MRAEYQAYYQSGIPVGGTAVRELRPLGKGLWLYHFDVDSFLVDVQESSQLRWQDGWLVPQDYRYRRKAWMRTREADLHFNWSKMTVLNNVQNQPWTMDIPPNTQDKLSYQLQLHLDLIAGKTHMVYPVADGGILKELEFAVQGEERIETRLGKVDTLVVDKLRQSETKRSTRLWFAKDWNYLLVKMIQREEDGEVYEIELVKAVVDGRVIQ